MISMIFHVQNYNNEVFMNKNQKSKPLPPSPRSSNARKPLINITNMYNNSAELPCRPTLNKPSSTKNLKPRISIDECNRPKIKEVHSRKNSRSGSIASSSGSLPKEKQQKCHKHANRTAIYRLSDTSSEYLCFECSFIFAKQGREIKSLAKSLENESKKNVNKEREEREKEAKQYVDKCKNTYNDLMKWRQDQAHVVKGIFEEFGKMIKSEETRMEEEIMKIKNIYGKHIEMLQNRREEKVEFFKKADDEVNKFIEMLSSTRQDIQNNYEECISEFSTNQFKEVMEEYWKILESAQFFVVSNSVMKLSKDSGIQMTLTVRSIENTKSKKDQEFTFSKQSRFETPPFEKSFKGIKQVDSYGHSGQGLPSELRESIVDSRFCFHDVNPFVA